MRRKLKNHAELQNDVYHWLSLDKESPLLLEIRKKFAAKQTFAFMDEAKETVMSQYKDESKSGQLMTRLQMAAAYGDVTKPCMPYASRPAHRILRGSPRYPVRL